jgi:hypothetical protein
MIKKPPTLLKLNGIVIFYSEVLPVIGWLYLGVGDPHTALWKISSHFQTAHSWK